MLSRLRRAAPVTAGLSSGPLLAFAFPSSSVAPLLFAALVPLLLALRGLPAGRRFLLGLGVGFLANLGILYTVADLLESMSDFSTVAAWAVLAGVCLYHGCLWGLFALGAEPLRALAPRAAWLTVPSLLVLCELAYPQLFPWYLGSGLVPLSPVAQVMDLVGVHGLSFLVVAAQVVLADLAATAWRERRLLRAPAVGLAVGVAAVLSYGTARRADVLGAAPGRPLRFAIVQPNYTAAQRRSADGQAMAAMGRSVLAQIQSLAPNTYDLVLLPEGSFPFPYIARPRPARGEVELPADRFAAAFADEARRLAAHLVFGTPRFVSERGPPRNSLVHLDPSGAVAGIYDKVRLVPFGERVPFEWMRGMFPGFEDLEPGDHRRPFRIAGHLVAPSICYEAIFPGDTRAALADPAVRVVANATNDVWFGLERNAPELHLLLQRARAVEERIVLLRAANTGISAVVLPDGSVADRTRVGEKAILSGTVSPPEIWSLYRLIGEAWFALPAAASLAILGLALRRRRRKA